jgi:hypothetical protein
LVGVIVDRRRRVRVTEDGVNRVEPTLGELVRRAAGCTVLGVGFGAVAAAVATAVARAVLGGSEDFLAMGAAAGGFTGAVSAAAVGLGARERPFGKAVAAATGLSVLLGPVAAYLLLIVLVWVRGAEP